MGSKNYNPIETIGDCVLKVVCSLHLYLKHPEYPESSLSKVRANLVSNNNLAQISDSEGLPLFLCGVAPPITKYRPPYFKGAIPNETSWTIRDLPTKIKADVLESIIGAFYLGHGLYDAASLIYKLKILEQSMAEQTLQYFNDSGLGHFDAKSFSGVMTISELMNSRFRSTPQDLYDLCDLFPYEFENIGLLRLAFTHRSSGEVHYDKLEFIGDAILDLVVLSSLFTLSFDLTSNELSMIKHTLVKNSTLGKLSVLMSLPTFLVASEDVKSSCQESIACLDWTENLIEFGSGKDDPFKVLGDLYESLIGAILVDSKSMYITLEIVADWMKLFFMYILDNRDKIEQNIKGRVENWCVGQGKTMRFKRSESDNQFQCEIYCGDDLLASDSALTKTLAEKNTVIKAFNKIINK